MVLQASSYAVPANTTIVGEIGTSHLLLRREDVLSVIDLATGAITAERAVPGLAHVEAKGSLILARDAKRGVLMSSELAGDVALPEAKGTTLWLSDVISGIAILTAYGALVCFDVAKGKELARSSEDVEWRAAHAGSGLVIGMRERTREVVALRVADGAIAWKTKPFAQKVDRMGHPSTLGDEVHVRASTLGEDVVARLDAKTGKVLGVRSGDDGIESWMPDFGEDVERAALRFERRSLTTATRDGIAVPQEDQVIIVRASGVSRVAKPAGMSGYFVHDSYVGLVKGAMRVELVVVPLPASGEHEVVVVVVPRGEDVAAEVGAHGVITFAGTSAPIVIVQHPQYGRVTLTRALSEPPPPVGAEVVFDGVEVTPGGTARVDRWWLAGARAPREERRLTLGAPVMATSPKAPEATHYAATIAKRAEAHGLAVPEALVRVLEIADAEPTFCAALAKLGLHLDEEEMSADVLEELEIEGFVACWGNGYGDKIGGFTKDGVAELWFKDDREPDLKGTMTEYLRRLADEADEDATADFVRDVLAREKLA